MKIYHKPDQNTLQKLTVRPAIQQDELHALVKQIFADIRQDGDQAVKAYTQKFDGVKTGSMMVGKKDIMTACRQVSDDLKNSITRAKKNIEKFHRVQIPSEINCDVEMGVRCWQKPVAIEKIGLYIPGGSAPLFSTVLMLAVPAIIAGCREVILASPPDRKTGEIHPAIIYTANLCGIKKIFKVGGAQAIAAMSLGTAEIPKVYKIFGPGNQYVTAAKQYAFQLGTGIDMPAGPSEVLVFADASARPEFIASDLLSQAEHGVDSQVILVSNDYQMITESIDAVHRQISSLPRKKIAEGALQNSFALYEPNVGHAFDYINEYAPEHLIIASNHAGDYLEYIYNAGSVFVGNYSPESAGDYASGTNHTLPTAACAKSFSGVNLDAYYKKITFQELTYRGLNSLSGTITTMAREEALEGHARAIDIRLKDKQDGNK